MTSKYETLRDAENALPEHIRAKNKADREKEEAELLSEAREWIAKGKNEPWHWNGVDYQEQSLEDDYGSFTAEVNYYGIAITDDVIARFCGQQMYENWIDFPDYKDEICCNHCKALYDYINSKIKA